MNLELSPLSEPVRPVLASLDADTQRTAEKPLGVPVMREIPLGRGMVALLDDGDYEKIAPYHWYAWKNKRSASFYAVSNLTSEKRAYMHRMILGVTDPKIEVDHENHNGLDNRRVNIRIVTHSFNQYQRGKKVVKKGVTPSSPYKGVAWHKATKKWILKVDEKYCGLFLNEREAAHAYDSKVISILGRERARIGLVLNFPLEA